jgi:hypothetical protein
MKRIPFALILPIVLIGLSVLAGSAAATKTDPDFRRAVIKPSLVRIEPGGQQRFKVIMLATYLMAASAPEEVIWSVNGIPGGNKKLGTIDPNGLYTAPKKAPMPCEIHICAEAPEAANRYLFATVLMGEPSYQLVHTWSQEIKSEEPELEEGKSTGSLKKPHGVCLDKEGNLLIADFGGTWEVLGGHLRHAHGQYDEGQKKLDRFGLQLTQIQSEEQERAENTN